MKNILKTVFAVVLSLNAVAAFADQAEEQKEVAATETTTDVDCNCGGEVAEADATQE